MSVFILFIKQLGCNYFKRLPRQFIFILYPANTKHVYNLRTALAQLLRLSTLGPHYKHVIQMFCDCLVWYKNDMWSIANNIQYYLLLIVPWREFHECVSHREWTLSTLYASPSALYDKQWRLLWCHHNILTPYLPVTGPSLHPGRNKPRDTANKSGAVFSYKLRYIVGYDIS